MNRFTVTYEIVTPESAEHGDAESRGFIDPGEWRTPVDEAIGRHADFTMTLREAMQLCYPIEDVGGWWQDEASQDYRTGAYETRAIHPPRNITASSYARVARVLGL